MEIITFEGSDYSGKSITLEHLSRQLPKEGIVFNKGPIYRNSLIDSLLSLAEQADDEKKEVLYTFAYLLDCAESKTHMDDNRVVFQDRYWPSVISYGRFLNKSKSIHMQNDFRPWFISPDVVIRFTCPYEEKLKRNKNGRPQSKFDQYLLENPLEVERLEHEIDFSLEGLPDIYTIDTTNKTIPEVADTVLNYLAKKIDLRKIGDKNGI
jgi:thymidylate kinase